MRTNKWIFALVFCAIGCNAFAQDGVLEFEDRVQNSSDPLLGGDMQLLPAVDGINTKFSIGFVGDDNDAAFATGSVTFPIGHSFGLQIDGGVAEVSTDLHGDIPVYSAAAHGFWRDPSVGLLGLYGDVAHIDLGSGYNLYTVGVEGSIYLDRFSVDAVVGAQRINQFNPDFFDEVNLNFYASDDFKLNIGHTYMLGLNSFLYGAEWAVPGYGRAAASIFAQGSIHESGEHTVEAGVRFYIGNTKKSLIRRHREDDPTVNSDLPQYVYIPVSDGGNYTIVYGKTSNGNLSSNTVIHRSR